MEPATGSDDVDEIIIIGTRPTGISASDLLDLGMTWAELVGEDLSFPGLESDQVGDDGGDPEDECSTEQGDALDDQADSAAEEAADQIRSQPSSSYQEYAVILYLENGEVRQSNVITNDDGTTVTFETINAEMDRLGISNSDVVGFVHNHPASEGGGNIPSGLDNMTALGMVSGDGSIKPFRTYIIDGDGNLVEYQKMPIECQ